MGTEAHKPVIVIAAGGTGGHIFPAIATGRKIMELAPDAQVIFACGERPLEVDLYKRNNISPVIFPARQIRSGITGKIMGVTAAAGNVLRAMKWVKSVNADLVVGFGGYVAGPTVLGARLAFCKTAIHEANSIPGRTNRILGPWMDLTASHFQSTLKKLGGKNQLAVGMPIRPLQSANGRGEARRALGLISETDTILIMGGSQGALYLYESIMGLLPAIDTSLNGRIQILWSTGEKHFEHLQLLTKKLFLKNISIKLVPFISDMGNALKSTDIAIARAGASAMAELTAFHVYTIYVPFPGAIYDHQTLNAREAERYELGRVVNESEVKDCLVTEILDGLEKVRGGYIPNPPPELDSAGAAERLAVKLLDLTQKQN